MKEHHPIVCRGSADISVPRTFRPGRALGAGFLAWMVGMLCFLGVFGSSRVEAGYGVSDGAHFFSEYARSESLKIIEQISDTLRKDFYVETFEGVPESVSKGVDLKNPVQAGRMYETWASSQASKKRVNGVYALVVRQPAHLHVVVGKETRKGAFTGADRDQLVKLMVGRLREKRYDEALIEGAGFVSAVMHANAPGGRSAGRAAALDAGDGGDLREGGVLDKFGGWWTVLGAVLAIWLLFRILGGLFGSMGGMGGGMAGGVQPGGGGGFFRSLMGGLFGAAAGMWIYDQFFGSHGHASEFGSETESTRDEEYSGSGGDFSSGGDSSDSGGGDFGDFGGGGDFGGDSGSGGE